MSVRRERQRASAVSSPQHRWYSPRDGVPDVDHPLRFSVGAKARVRDHRRESVVQTGAASNLGREPDAPARGRTDVRGWGAFAPSATTLRAVPGAHARGHLGLRPSIEGLSPPLASPCSPRVLGVGTRDQAVNHPGGCTLVVQALQLGRRCIDRPHLCRDRDIILVQTLEQDIQFAFRSWGRATDHLDPADSPI